ncbi:sigma-54 dependent transcriptional regulator [Psychrobium sp. 1_MG-2023]|uniref:sigma-54-dependent transcriptional regulator n=1 Tax=Psychrobium sp. 1_MG-2023 TaxID=3062624 RepID=UPI000C3477BC|nr:sigma-54 dependent transcriptional regulator [Psychrobium sp. 1_MG-2023]MDP2561339.1 sigma-54 dependent transcriptional regulator [Psychrobium sp. 1_MG-2023]PKF54153.1 sigma-54-dependent Fis family transcriptional regulator [Alteromonadales bacterium alter-6D02]
MIEQTNNLPTLLLVDDEQEILSALKRVLRSLPVNIVTYTSPTDALAYCQHNFPSVVISDQHMPDLEGCELLAKIQKIWPESQRIILSGYQDFAKVSSAFSQGSIERFICKPWDNKELTITVEQALAAVEQSKPAAVLNTQSQSVPNSNFHGIIANTSTMHELFENISHAGATHAPIFITGETGTGKELVAKACHAESPNNQEPFIAVNCANFSEHLMESQLFGHNKGAFTGAITAQEGLFSAAKKGTLFLDEITTLSKPLQAKLLRVIQEREYSPLGTNKVYKFDAKIISASSNSIGAAVVNNEFREDLYYRLNVINLTLPPLRERALDAQLIGKFFLKKYSKLANKSFKRFSRDALQIIKSYAWPGNVRQLENTIHGIVVLNHGDEINSQMLIKALSNMVNNLSPPKQQASATTEAVETIAETQVSTSGHPASIIPLWQVEKQAIESAIDSCNGNVAKAAALLEVSPSTIYRKKQEWDS